ncbi:jerky protein-like [Hetaerina americana]|uniref:jerky protein-like n=1 Tax=Hetaerina americana TaxID=62018 RepID=UPI003A7F0F68
MEICNHLERGVSRKILMKLFNIGYSTITNIKAQEGVLRKFLSESKPEKSGERRSTLRKGKLEKLEEALFEWYKTSRSEGSRVSRSMVKEKAKQLYEQMKIEEPCAFSNGWLARFKARHGIRCFAAEPSHAVVTVFHGASEIFCEYFSTLVVEHDLSADQIYSACESNLLWRSLNDAGVHKIKRINDDFMSNKEQLTALVCANASGNHKLQVLAVGEDELSSQGDAGTSIVYNRRSIGRMDKELYNLWFETIFVPSIKLNLKNIGKSEDSKVLLLLDNCVQQLLDELNSYLLCMDALPYIHWALGCMIKVFAFKTIQRPYTLTLCMEKQAL